MSYNNWIKELKVGDKIVMTVGGMSTKTTIETVERFTKTLVITTGGRFRKDTSYASGGDSWRPSRIEKITPVIEERINDNIAKRAAVKKVTDLVAWGKLYRLNTSTLHKIIEVIQANKS